MGMGDRAAGFAPAGRSGLGTAHSREAGNWRNSRTIGAQGVNLQRRLKLADVYSRKQETEVLVSASPLPRLQVSQPLQ